LICVSNTIGVTSKRTDFPANAANFARAGSSWVSNRFRACRNMGLVYGLRRRSGSTDTCGAVLVLFYSKLRRRYLGIVTPAKAGAQGLGSARRGKQRSYWLEMSADGQDEYLRRRFCTIALLRTDALAESRTSNQRLAVSNLLAPNFTSFSSGLRWLCRNNVSCTRS
jgi:hypothetical protein